MKMEGEPEKAYRLCRVDNKERSSLLSLKQIRAKN
jgi:hypothetical protein